MFNLGYNNCFKLFFHFYLMSESMPEPFVISKGYYKKLRKLKKNLFRDSNNQCSMRVLTKNQFIKCLEDSNMNGYFGGPENFIERFEGQDLHYGRYFEGKSNKFCLNFSDIGNDNYLIRYNKLEKIVEIKERE